MAIYQRVQIQCTDCGNKFRGEVRSNTKGLSCPACKGFVKKTTNWRGSYEITYYKKGRRIKECIGRVNRKIAEKTLADRKTAILEGRYIKRKKESDMTLAELGLKYLEWARRHKKPNSVRRDRVSIKPLERSLGNRTIDDIEPPDVERHIVRRLEVDFVSRATVNRETTCLKAMFRQALQWGYTENTPLAGIKLMRENNERDRILTPVELKILIDSAPPQLAPILFLLANTGMRKEEAVGLRWSDINLQERIMVLRDTKNHEVREVPMNDNVLEVLERLPRSLKYEEVFLNFRKNGPLRKIQYAWRRTTEEAARCGMDVTDLWIHDIRRTWITRAVEAGIDLPTISKIAGVKTIKTLIDKYTRVDQDHRHEAVQKVVTVDITKPTPIPTPLVKNTSSQKPVSCSKENGGTGRTRTADKGFADLCLTTWRRCLKCEFKTKERKSGAGEGVRTLDFNLGKVALYH